MTTAPLGKTGLPLLLLVLVALFSVGSRPGSGARSRGGRGSKCRPKLRRSS